MPVELGIDILVVWKLDRLGRSLAHLVATVVDLAGRSVGFRSLQEQLDTTTAGGKLIFLLFTSLAEFECDLIRERRHAGLTALPPALVAAIADGPRASMKR